MVLLFVGVLAPLDEGFAMFEHAVDGGRELASGGGDRLGGTKTSAHAPVESSQGGLALVQGLSGNAQGGGDTVGAGS